MHLEIIESKRDLIADSVARVFDRLKECRYMMVRMVLRMFS